MSVIHIYCVLSSSIKFYLVPRVDCSLSALQPECSGELGLGWWVTDLVGVGGCEE